MVTLAVTAYGSDHLIIQPNQGCRSSKKGAGFREGEGTGKKNIHKLNSHPYI